MRLNMVFNLQTCFCRQVSTGYQEQWLQTTLVRTFTVAELPFISHRESLCCFLNRESLCCTSAPLLSLSGLQSSRISGVSSRTSSVPSGVHLRIVIPNLFRGIYMLYGPQMLEPITFTYTPFTENHYEPWAA